MFGFGIRSHIPSKVQQRNSTTFQGEGRRIGQILNLGRWKCYFNGERKYRRVSWLCIWKFILDSEQFRYLRGTYDKSHSYLPALGDPRRYDVLQRLHSSEGTFVTHALAITYARWFQKDGSIQTTEEGLKGNIIKDFDYLEKTLISSGGEWICGKTFTVADMMMHSSITFILARELGTNGKSWETINEGVKNCEKKISFRKQSKQLDVILVNLNSCNARHK